MQNIDLFAGIILCWWLPEDASFSEVQGTQCGAWWPCSVVSRGTRSLSRSRHESRVTVFSVLCHCACHCVNTVLCVVSSLPLQSQEACLWVLPPRPQRCIMKLCKLAEKLEDFYGERPQVL